MIQRKLEVTYEPFERTTRVPPGTTLFSAAHWIGLPIDSTCGGRGTCGKCKVQVLSGAGALTDADERFLSEAEELLKKLQPTDGSNPKNPDEIERQIGLLIYRVKLGTPKSIGLMRLLEDPQNLRLLNKAELELHADQVAFLAQPLQRMSA